MRRRTRVVLVALLSALGAPPAFADNLGSVPLGGRTATMGGAGTAFSNDSAMPYLNPAGLAGLPLDVFALSATVYSSTSRQAEDFSHPRGFETPATDVRDTLSSSDIAELPSSVMYVLTLHEPSEHFRHLVAMSLTTPAAERFTLDSTFEAQLPSVDGSLEGFNNVRYSSTDIFVGPTWAAAVGERLRFGATAYLLHVRQSFVQTDGLVIIEQAGASAYRESEAISLNADGTSFTGIVGVQVMPLTHFWLGAALQLPTIDLHGSMTRSQEESEDDGGEVALERSLVEGDARIRRPGRLSLGVGYDRHGAFAAAGQVSLGGPHDRALELVGRERVVEQRTGDLTRSYTSLFTATQSFEPTVNVAVGGEYWLDERVALRAGAFVDRATRDVDPAEAADRSVDRYGLTAGIGWQIGSFDTTVGAVYQYGTGRIVASDSTSTAARTLDQDAVSVDLRAHTLAFVFSGVVTTEEAKRVIESRSPIPLDPEVPEVELPEVELPRVEVPEVELPEVEVPELQVPGVQVPRVEMPDVEVPDVDVPDVPQKLPIPIMPEIPREPPRAPQTAPAPEIPPATPDEAPPP